MVNKGWPVYKVPAIFILFTGMNHLFGEYK